MRLIIARPSPYARKARIALQEKAIAYDEIIENPWMPQTSIKHFNPLGKVPSLILDDGRVVHDSKVIVEYLDTLERAPRLIPQDPGMRVAHKQIEAVADGVCDAIVLVVLERSRAPDKQSENWIERQRLKIEAGTAELSRLLGEGEWFTASGFGLAEVATGCALGYIGLRFPEFDWQPRYPNLKRLYESLMTRSSFANTVPAAQELPLVL